MIKSQTLQTMHAEHIDTVRAFEVGKPDSLCVVIPKEARMRLKIRTRDKFTVSIDPRGRLVYEPVIKDNTTS